jgi:hypothetical protein
MRSLEFEVADCIAPGALQLEREWDEKTAGGVDRAGRFPKALVGTAIVRGRSGSLTDIVSGRGGFRSAGGRIWSTAAALY